jgi:Subtilase family
MEALTRRPKLLVKMSPGPKRLTLAAGKSKFGVKAEPLFQSIKDKPKVGLAQAPQWHMVAAASDFDEVNVWDLCHEAVTGGLGMAAGGRVEFAEPDLEQRWIFGTEAQSLLAAAGSCEKAQAPDSRLPSGEGLFWFRDQAHSQLQAARDEVGQPASRVRIAHFDTGYDPAHITKPQFLLPDLQKNFEDGDPKDATDHSEGAFNNLGHGPGTISILAGAVVDGSPLGGAAFLDVIPVRVANSVVLFKNSTIAKAFDYVHSLSNDPSTRVQVITMSMGGLASQAWADAVNALYDLGVFIVTAAGNNFGNFPTRSIVYPARFKRVIAACGAMANGKPYADLPLRIMAGNYGPESKMQTALAAYTPNTPWARMGCNELVDHDGRGTSAATPQIAAAAALWIQKHKAKWEGYSQGWMRVEAVRKALADSAKLEKPADSERLGRGIIRAQAALAQTPAKESVLVQQPKDSVSFPFFKVLTGLGITGSDQRQQMLELEAIQLMQQSKELEDLLPDPEQPETLSAVERETFVEALVSTPGASRTLREALGVKVRAARPQVTVPKKITPVERALLDRAINPPASLPVTRPLRVFAFDPLAATKLETLEINETTIPVSWEPLEPGPVGEYLEVVDVDPATGVAYAPVDLNQPLPLSQGGLNPSESNPQFHQQMVYAVAMKTIAHFERALGRVALWAPRIVKTRQRYEEHFVRRLRIYPHALREANAYYSPDKHALLFGYFRASECDPGENLPGQTVFCCLSHDIVAHETTHALLDGLHRRFREPTNADVLGFHEAFADIVALFQHFTVPEALRDQIAKTRGDLAQQSLLGQLAQQFGQGIGRYGALRDAIGEVEKKKRANGKDEDSANGKDENSEEQEAELREGEWKPTVPTPADYKNATEPHDRGAVLVAAVFDAFLNIYRQRSRDLLRLATGGTGVLPPGDISYDLVTRLAKEASKTASHVLNMCIRALDYLPPVDMTFGEYVRALITADRDLVPDDDLGYRVAFLQAFRRRGIYPEFVRNLSTESVIWSGPETKLNISECLKQMTLTWDLRADRRAAYETSRKNARTFNKWLKKKIDDEEKARSFGFSRAATLLVGDDIGKLSPFEVHSVRPVRRVGPDGQQRLDLVVEITQSWTPKGGDKYRGGSTLIIDLERNEIRYVVRKRVGHAERIASQQGFRMSLADSYIRSNYYDDIARGREPFAMLHRGA